MVQALGVDDPNFIAWRCYHGAVLACVEGGSHPLCGEKDGSGVPSPHFRTYCRENPNADMLPGFIDGGHTAFVWGCRRGQPRILRRAWQLDERSFPIDRDLWKPVSP